MSFPIYLVGVLFVVGGIAWALALMHVPALYITSGCVILVGIGILSGVSHTRQKDPPG